MKDIQKLATNEKSYKASDTLKYAIWFYGKWKLIHTKASLFNSNALVTPDI